jgi:hypothetical protein
VLNQGGKICVKEKSKAKVMATKVVSGAKFNNLKQVLNVEIKDWITHFTVKNVENNSLGRDHFNILQG